jgi:hypothetical protein
MTTTTKELTHHEVGHAAVSLKLREIAYHEAGHAVVSWRLHRKFISVTIEPDNDSLGKVRFYHSKMTEGSSDDALRLHAERVAIGSYAAQIAQQKCLGKKATFDCRMSNASWDPDNRQADDAAIDLLQYTSDVLDAFLGYCFVRAVAIVDREWPRIEALAAALLERKTMNYADVLEIMNPGSRALRETFESSKKIRKAPAPRVWPKRPD